MNKKGKNKTLFWQNKNQQNAGINGCGGKTRTYDLWVMSPTSCQLLHPAMCQHKYYTTIKVCCQY